LLGGRLCLDFANTLDWRGTDTPVEFLNTYQDLVVWSRHAGICTHRDARQLAIRAEWSAAEAKEVHRRAIELREIIYCLFAAISQNKNPSKEELIRFNKELSLSMKDTQIKKISDGYTLDATGNKSKLGWILNPIIRSAAEVLVSDELKNIKSCADPACGWLFLDISRNKRRRWCDMQDCGNRAKASRFYKNRRQRN
jgi:predicted RNA-binding Zn ribbon-like protein